MTSRALYALHAYHSQICLLKYGSVGYGDRRLVLRLITLTSRYESNETVSMNTAHLLLNIFNWKFFHRNVSKCSKYETECAPVFRCVRRHNMHSGIFKYMNIMVQVFAQVRCRYVQFDQMEF